MESVLTKPQIDYKDDFRQALIVAKYEIMKFMSGKKILIVGNHDRSWCTGAASQKYFREIHNLHYITDGGKQIVLCHFPMMSWAHELRSYMIFGHIHNRTDVRFWPLIRENPQMLNAGADINGFKPVTLPELIQNNDAFKRDN